MKIFEKFFGRAERADVETIHDRGCITFWTFTGKSGYFFADDPQDTGVKCYIDYAQNVVSTGKMEIVLRVKPYVYAKYIDVKLGFMVID
jgi:hypothetical protein